MGPEQGSAKGKLGKGKMISGISTGTEKTLELSQTVKQSPANVEFEGARRQLMLGCSRKGDGHWARPPQRPSLSQETPLSPICWSSSYTDPARFAVVSPLILLGGVSQVYRWVNGGGVGVQPSRPKLSIPRRHHSATCWSRRKLHTFLEAPTYASCAASPNNT